MFFLNKLKGILGMNARNLLYITRFNSQANKRFADDKIYTKNFLSSRNIKVAKIYSVIQSYEELRHLKPDNLPSSFVIKPNRGFGGEGIQMITGRKDNLFLDPNNQSHDWRDLNQHMIAILEGKYAISGLRDKIIIEELLYPHEYFRNFVDSGLPDIRIIVFNLIPVVAMLRLPTRDSEGKANLHLGAIGLGIDLATGKTTFGVQYNKFITKLPNGDRVNTIELPEWDEVLQTASFCQKVSDIGYLAVDIALTDKGVRVLELNARAGLSVQIANRVLLKSRLEKIADIKVLSPEKGIEIAKMLFAKRAHTTKEKKDHEDSPRVIGTEEEVVILNAEGKRLQAKIDPHYDETLLSSEFPLDENVKLLDIQIGEQRLKIPFKKTHLPQEKFQLIIAGKHLKGFLINPSATHLTLAGEQKKDEKILLSIDKKISELVSSIHFLSRLKPVNLEETKKFFLEHPTGSPEFHYRSINLDVDAMKRDLTKISRDVDHPLSPLYWEKIGELKTRLALLEARGTKEIMRYSKKLYGDVTRKEFDDALRYTKTRDIKKDTSKILKIDQVETAVKGYLSRHNLGDWKVVTLENTVADMQINRRGTIFIRKQAQISENRLHALIAHEIETHIFRNENGKLNPFRILEQGTARYLETEEGLAIFNQERTGVNLGEKHIWAAWRIIGIWHGKQMGFVDLFHHLKKEYEINDEAAWHICVKVKRGLSDTSLPVVFTKDRVYFGGLQKIKDYFAREGGEGMRRLYLGKIKPEDLPYLESLKDIRHWRVKYFPGWYYV